MARSKAISVKVATPKVIKALEGALAKLELDYTSQEANEAKYQKQYEKYRKELVIMQLQTSRRQKTSAQTIVLGITT